MLLLILASFLLQCTLFQTLSIASVSPNLMLILTVSFALMRGKREGMFIGLLCGFLTDIYYGGSLGFYMLLYTYVGFINGYCCHIFYDDDIKMPILLVCVSDVAYNLIVYGFQFLLRGRTDLLYYLRRIIIPEVIYTAILTMLCYRLLLALNRKLEKAEQRSVDSFV
jgi:rod shape-determining protein MreD